MIDSEIQAQANQSDNSPNDIHKLAFNRARMPIKIAAEALGVDPQTLRIMLQQEIVDFGIAFKRPGSQRCSYFISPKKFYESTGFLWREGLKVE